MNDKPLNIRALDEADPMWRERKLGIKVIESDQPKDMDWETLYRRLVTRLEQRADKRTDERTMLFVSVGNRDLFERTIAMADAVCDLSEGLTDTDWHDCLDDLAIILAAHRSGEASR